MPVFTHPMSRAAGALFDAAVAKLGVAAASRWMFSGHDGLGGRSPLQALKAGRIVDLKRLLLNAGGKP